MSQGRKTVFETWGLRTARTDWHAIAWRAGVIEKNYDARIPSERKCAINRWVFNEKLSLTTSSPTADSTAASSYKKLNLDHGSIRNNYCPIEHYHHRWERSTQHSVITPALSRTEHYARWWQAYKEYDEKSCSDTGRPTVKPLKTKF